MLSTVDSQRLRPLWSRVMAAHRRYTSANGDALSGALTYALLVGAAPAVLLATTALAAAGTPVQVVARALHSAATRLLPGVVASEAEAVHPEAVPVRLALLLALCWTALRLVRAARTGIRAMCGQNAGSGNPLADAARDAVLGVGLLVAGGVLVGLTAQGGPLAGVPLLWLGFTAAMRHGSWPAAGRPSLPAALRAALVAALLVGALSALGGWYLHGTELLHREVYRSAGNLVGALVWTSLACRIFLRATAWAATAGAPDA